MTVGEGVSSLAIYRYAPNTNKVGTRPFGLAVLLKALNAIYRTASLSIPGSSTTIICIYILLKLLTNEILSYITYNKV